MAPGHPGARAVHVELDADVAPGLAVEVGESGEVALSGGVMVEDEERVAGANDPLHLGPLVAEVDDDHVAPGGGGRRLPIVTWVEVDRAAEA